MKREDLFEGFGALEDDLLERSERRGISIKRGDKEKRTVHKILRLGSIAACLAVAIGVGVYFMDGIKAPGVLDKQNKLQGGYVDISTLLASAHGAEQQALVLCHVNIQDYDAIYQKARSVESGRLGGSIGSEVAGMENWYKVSGHEDMQYLISYDGSEYSLWEFNSFRTVQPRDGQDENPTKDPQESYPYMDVMKIIYNIRSAEDIAEIIVAPPTMDNSAKGKEIQAEIGTNTVTNVESIKTLYTVLSGLTCYGDGHWEMIGLGQDTPSAMLEYIRAGRYLTIVTSQGMEIDTLKYTGISSMFYEYGGIAYNVLMEEEKSAVEEILNIKPGNSAGSPTDGAADNDVADNNTADSRAADNNTADNDAADNNATDNNAADNKATNDNAADINTAAADSKTEPGNSQADDSSSDIPVDEDTYHEAREYSAELSDLQIRISEAMRTKELPFVIESAIYENPDRLHVVVTTKDEELLARLKAFDTTGGLLEIEYSEYNNAAESLVEKR